MPPPAYAPLDCARYSELELAIMRQQRLLLRWHGRGMQHIETVLPLDLRTRRHAEYLVHLNGTGQRRFLRLDRIIQFNPR